MRFNVSGFRNGFVAGLLGFAFCNALSYFYWSPGGGNILGNRPDRQESLGFPYVIWDHDGRTSLAVTRIDAMMLDVAFALIGSLLVGLAVGLLVRTRPTSARSATPSRWRFDLKSLFAAMSVIAAAAAVGRIGIVSPAWVLAAIYALGPALIVTVAVCTSSFPSGGRGLAIMALTALLIMAVVLLGHRVDAGGDFTHALLRMFVCWTPQLVVMAVIALLSKRGAMPGMQLGALPGIKEARKESR